jgi:predicted dinucleotide-binding enzyme
VVKAVNNLPARTLREPVRQGDERAATPVAADDNDAACIVEALIADMRFATGRVRTLAEAAEPLDVGARCWCGAQCP